MDLSQLCEREFASGMELDESSLLSSMFRDKENRIDVDMMESLSKGDSLIGNASCGIINGKEKSPMCLVNELCRFNSITCRYELIEESGAPHSRIFSVLLRLGDKEEYRASAPSIRKAQHSAASLALLSTKYSQPSPKSERQVTRNNSQLTPTVELNVLAMKRREPVQYHVFEQPIRPNLLSNLIPFTSNQLSATSGDLHHLHRNLYQQRHHLVRGMLTPWYIATVAVGDRQFTGKGKTVQIARHSAAEEALKTLRQLPMPNLTSTIVPVTNLIPPVVLSSIEVDADDEDSKSPVSMIYEAAMKRKYLVQFDVISESGPSHMPCFVVKCIVGQYSAEGRGVRKKTAKRRAAAAVLAELEEKEPISENSGQTKATSINTDPSPTSSSPTKEKSSGRFPKKRSTAYKSKKKKDQSLGDQVDGLTAKLQNTSISTEMNTNCPKSESTPSQSVANNQKKLDGTSLGHESRLMNSSFTLNPISRLLQLQLAKKEDEPKFKLISEVDVEHRRKEFTIQCSIAVPKSSRFIGTATVNNELITFGCGPNKRIAKRNSADEMLKILGYSSSTTTTTTTTLSSSSSSSSSSMTSHSRSPILKMSESNSPTESNCNQFGSQEINQQSRVDSGKERRVKFMLDTVNNPRDHNHSLTERLENLSEMTNQQLSSQSDKYGRQLAPGLLYVMSMNQANGNLPIRLMDNNNTVDKL